VNIVDIAAGAAHCLALSDKGHVYSWGSRDHLQLGRKITEDGNKGLFPTRIGTLDNIVSIACGAYHSFAVNRYGQLFAWGLNHFQQCGLVRKIPETEEILPGNVIHHPTMVPYFSRADQDYYQLRSSQKEDKGKQPNSQASDMQEEEIEELMEDETEAELSAVKMTPAAETEPNTTDNRYAKIKSVSCGEYHTIILMDNNRLVVFGRCDGGQLGVVLYPDYNYAGAMKLKGSNQVYAIGYPMENLWHCEYEIKKVVCGANHNLILTQDGATYGFGHSGYCQLGLYSEKDVKAFPTLIESIHNIGRVVNASAGDRFSMFIVA
jgi:alpha-tubulin suppressor-like RCC1 family protein